MLLPQRKVDQRGFGAGGGDDDVSWEKVGVGAVVVVESLEGGVEVEPGSR